MEEARKAEREEKLRKEAEEQKYWEDLERQMRDSQTPWDVRQALAEKYKSHEALLEAERNKEIKQPLLFGVVEHRVQKPTRKESEIHNQERQYRQCGIFHDFGNPHFIAVKIYAIKGKRGKQVRLRGDSQSHEQERERVFSSKKQEE